MKIVIASNNQNKIREFKNIFEKKDFTLVSLKEIGLDIDVLEDGKSFKENALIKAREISKLVGMPAIADDSGLECFGLNNEPGIYSARYAGGHCDSDNNELLMKNIKNIEDRRARYVCAICLYMPSGKYVTVEDYCYGTIIDEARGNNGFGYDPYFLVEEYNRTMAEITLEEKNLISHRAKALNKLEEIYNEIINS